jgi:3-oxoacyl-(acyl-carrier-protein) synthase
MFMSNGPAGMIAIEYGAKGPAFSVASACASGADGIGSLAAAAFRAMDAAIAGAGGHLCKLGVGGFDRLGRCPATTMISP